jgi:hypothetical protein
MSNRMVGLMLGIVAGAGAVVWLLLRSEPHSVQTTPPQPATVTAPPEAAQPVEPAPVTAKTLTAPPSGHPEQPVPNAPGPTPLPPGVTLREGHASGEPVPHEKMEKMPLEQKLEKASQLAKVLETQAALLDKEAADADVAGKSDEAAHKRVLVKRLRARVDELRSDVDHRQEPQ